MRREDYWLHRGVEQLVARQAHNLEVARSSPASATLTSEVVEHQHFGRFFVLMPDIKKPPTHHAQEA